MPQYSENFLKIPRSSRGIRDLFLRKSEAATGVFYKQRVFLEISQNSQENTYARVSF